MVENGYYTNDVGVVVKAYADNDGGLWYYDPVTGRTETVNEQSDDDIRLHEAEFP